MISEKATFRFILPGESNEAHEVAWEILVLGVLGKLLSSSLFLALGVTGWEAV